MDEKDVLKRSMKLMIIGCLIFGMMSILCHDLSLLNGFILGYVINVIAFFLIIKTADGILKYSMSTVIIVITFMLKLVLYALGFFIAVKSQWFHIVGVFFGYMITKLSIFVEGYVHKGGE